MKIQVESSLVTTKINIYIPASERHDGKDFRSKRTFQKVLSPKVGESLKTLLEELFSQQLHYLDCHRIFGLAGIEELLLKKYDEEMNSYQLKMIPELLSDIGFPLINNEASLLELYTIRDSYKLHGTYDFLISVIGAFGCGKTTLIKEILGFDDSYKFLLVDGGRTTIFNTIIRAMITVQKGDGVYVMTVQEQGEEEEQVIMVPLSDYLFQNKISFYTPEYFYRNVIAPNLCNGFEAYRSSGQDSTKALKAFVEYAKCSLDSLFGLITDSDNGFYGYILETYQEIFPDYAKDEDLPDFTTDVGEGIRQKFYTWYQIHLNQRIEKLQEVFAEKEGRSFQVEEDSISFQLGSEDLTELDSYYKYFTDNRIKGKGLRLLVKEIYLETDVDVSKFQNNEGNLLKPLNLYADPEKEETLKIHSLVFMDTVGCGHTQTNMQTTEGGTDGDILNITQLLHESDVILLLDKSPDSMQTGIIAQFATLESMGLKDKVLLCYSHYNQLVKRDFTTDGQREDYLLGHLNRVWEREYNVNDSKKGTELYKLFTQEISNEPMSTVSYDSNRNIVFLKGIKGNVQLVPVEHTSNANTRQKSGGSSEENDSLYQANLLNESCKNSNDCLAELINKMILLTETYQNKKDSQGTLVNLSTKESFAFDCYEKLFSVFLENYLACEKKVYLENIPAWNTSRSLCDNARRDVLVFYGSTTALTPFPDMMSAMSSTLTKFLEDVTAIDIVKNEENRHSLLTVDFLKDEIKTGYTFKMFIFLRWVIGEKNLSQWNRLYHESGSGVKKRRANGIYQLLKDSCQLDIVKVRSLELLRESIQEVFDQYNS